MFKEKQKVIYIESLTSYGKPVIPYGAKGVIIKRTEDEMLVDFFEHGKAIVVPSCLKADE